MIKQYKQTLRPEFGLINSHVLLFYVIYFGHPWITQPPHWLFDYALSSTSLLTANETYTKYTCIKPYKLHLLFVSPWKGQQIYAQDNS
jgi:hypothetical protein